MCVNVFWDNSNIMWVGRDTSLIREPGHDFDFRIHFRNLFQFAVNNRKISYAFAAGSIPPETDELWQYFTKLGITLEKQERGEINGREIAVDESIQRKMLERIIDVDHPETIVLLTGDGNGYYQGKGFIPQLERAVKKRWQIEVISWDCGCHGMLKKYAQEHGIYRDLDSVYENVTFTKDRIATPFP